MQQLAKILCVWFVFILNSYGGWNTGWTNTQHSIEQWMITDVYSAIVERCYIAGTNNVPLPSYAQDYRRYEGTTNSIQLVTNIVGGVTNVYTYTNYWPVHTLVTYTNAIIQGEIVFTNALGSWTNIVRAGDRGTRGFVDHLRSKTEALVPYFWDEQGLGGTNIVTFLNTDPVTTTITNSFLEIDCAAVSTNTNTFTWVRIDSYPALPGNYTLTDLREYNNIGFVTNNGDISAWTVYEGGLQQTLGYARWDGASWIFDATIGSDLNTDLIGDGYSVGSNFPKAKFYPSGSNSYNITFNLFGTMFSNTWNYASTNDFTATNKTVSLSGSITNAEVVLSDRWSSITNITSSSDGVHTGDAVAIYWDIPTNQFKMYGENFYYDWRMTMLHEMRSVLNSLTKQKIALDWLDVPGSDVETRQTGSPLPTNSFAEATGSADSNITFSASLGNPYRWTRGEYLGTHPTKCEWFARSRTRNADYRYDDASFVTTNLKHNSEIFLVIEASESEADSDVSHTDWSVSGQGVSGVPAARGWFSYKTISGQRGAWTSTTSFIGAAITNLPAPTWPADPQNATFYSDNEELRKYLGFSVEDEHIILDWTATDGLEYK